MAIASKVKITIDGQELKDFLNFRIEQSLSCPHTFEIVCRREALENQGGFLLDKSIDQIGSVVNITIEGIGAGNSQFFFKGIITGLSASDSFGNSEILLSGNSTDILLCDRPQCRSFEDMTLKDIVRNVAGSYPTDILNSNVAPDNPNEFQYIVQYKENNFDFLKRLAQRYGEWYYNDGSKLIFGPPSKDKVSMILGLDLSSFDIALKLDPVKFKYVHYDYLNPDNPLTSKSSGKDPSNNLNDTGKRVFEKSRKRFDVESTSYFHHLNGPESDYRNELEKAVDTDTKARAVGMTQIKGAGTSFLKLGNVVGVKAKKEAGGDVDYGEYIVTSIIHTCDNLSNYQNTFTGIPSEAMVPPYAEPASKPTCEIQSAIVKDRNDPENIGRVRVNFYWQKSDQKTPWLRVSHPDAGHRKGIFSVPELEDEVLIGFESGDAEKPFIMGSFHHSKAKPSDKWKDMKDVKFITSKTGAVILIDDREGEERIALYKAGGDLYGIELNWAEKRIMIATDHDLILNGKNIIIDAKEKVEIKSGKDVTVSGGSVSVSGDTTIHGSNVSLKGDSQVKAEGATVSIDGSATTEIKGGIVKIN